MVKTRLRKGRGNKRNYLRDGPDPADEVQNIYGVRFDEGPKEMGPEDLIEMPETETEIEPEKESPMNEDSVENVTTIELGESSDQDDQEDVAEDEILEEETESEETTEGEEYTMEYEFEVIQSFPADGSENFFSIKAYGDTKRDALATVRKLLCSQERYITTILESDYKEDNEAATS